MCVNEYDTFTDTVVNTLKIFGKNNFMVDNVVKNIYFCKCRIIKKCKITNNKSIRLVLEKEYINDFKVKKIVVVVAICSTFNIFIKKEIEVGCTFHYSYNYKIDGLYMKLSNTNVFHFYAILKQCGGKGFKS